jgi:hypothetical protein
MKRVVPFVLLAAACGDPVTGSDYRGEPILRLTGRIDSVGPGIEIRDGEEALVSMFWKTDLSTTATSLRAQDSVSTAIEFPSSFEIRIFEPPTGEDLVQSDGRFGLGLLLVYLDRDGDRAFDREEPLIGGNLAKAIAWASEPVSADESPFSLAIPEGFSLVSQPFVTCTSQPPPGGMNRGPLEGSHVSTCFSDDMCPPEFACDHMFSVCVPRDTFRLVIGGEFDIDHASCPPRR